MTRPQRGCHEEKLWSFAFICFFTTAALQPAVAHLRGLAVGRDGAVYVAATGCRVVVRIDRRGIVSTVLRAEAPWAPTAVALDGNAVYVLDYLHTPGDDRRR